MKRCSEVSTALNHWEGSTEPHFILFSVAFYHLVSFCLYLSSPCLPYSSSCTPSFRGLPLNSSHPGLSLFCCRRCWPDKQLISTSTLIPHQTLNQNWRPSLLVPFRLSLVFQAVAQISLVQSHWHRKHPPSRLVGAAEILPRVWLQTGIMVSLSQLWWVEHTLKYDWYWSQLERWEQLFILPWGAVFFCSRKRIVPQSSIYTTLWSSLGQYIYEIILLNFFGSVLFLASLFWLVPPTRSKSSHQRANFVNIFLYFSTDPPPAISPPVSSFLRLSFLTAYNLLPDYYQGHKVHARHLRQRTATARRRNCGASARYRSYIRLWGYKRWRSFPTKDISLRGCVGRYDVCLTLP